MTNATGITSWSFT